MASFITPLSPFRRPRLVLPRYGRGEAISPPTLLVTSLTATPGLGQVILAYTCAVPGDVAAVEIWASKTNDRSAAAHYGDCPSPTSFTHVISPQAGSFFYWVRAKDALGSNIGDWYPASSTAGVQATWNNASGGGIPFNQVTDTWINYSTTLDAKTGTLTSAAASARYKLVGTTLYFWLSIHITTNGSADGYLRATLPVSVNSTKMLAGVLTEVGAPGIFKSLCAVAPSNNTLVIFKADGTYPGSDGADIIVSGVVDLT